VVRQLSPSELAQRLREAPEGTVLLDVREPWEREIAAIAPSLHIPMNEVPQRTGELPRDRSIVVYCHSGARSLLVAAFLEGQGFPAVTNLDGGIDRWSVEVDPKVARYD
jgi:rhodanese-related sulfurtransferase